MTKRIVGGVSLFVLITMSSPDALGQDIASYCTQYGGTWDAFMSVCIPAGSVTVSPPAAPTILSLSTNGLYVTLRWADNSNNEESFRIFRRIPPDAYVTSLPVATVSANATEVIDALGLQAGKTYEYIVVACNSSRCSPSGAALVTITIENSNLSLDCPSGFCTPPTAISTTTYSPPPPPQVTPPPTTPPPTPTLTSTLVTVRGITKFDNGSPVSDAFLGGWSEEGKSVRVRSSQNGEVVFTIPFGRWHFEAGREVDGFPYRSSNLRVDVSGDISLEIVLSRIGTKPLPPAAVVTQPVSQTIVAHVEDGTQVTIPPHAVSQTGNVHVQVNPTIEAPSHAAAQVVSTVYDVKLTDDFGKAVTQFQKEIEIVIPYDRNELLKRGVTEDAVAPGYFDEAAGVWVKVDNFTIDKAKSVFVVRVTHLTRFALIAAADVTPPEAPREVRMVGTGAGFVNLMWKNPSSDFSHVKIYRSLEAGKLGILVANNVINQETKDATVPTLGVYYYTVRAVDPAGNESTNINQAIAVVTKGPQARMAFTRSLSYGSRGEDVSELQRALTREEVYSGPVTGFFGVLTRAGVIRFQEKYKDSVLVQFGLVKGTGFVGKATLAKLNSPVP